MSSLGHARSITNRLIEAGVVGVGDGASSSKRILTTPAIPTNSLLLNIKIFIFKVVIVIMANARVSCLYLILLFIHSIVKNTK